MENVPMRFQDRRFGMTMKNRRSRWRSMVAAIYSFHLEMLLEPFPPVSLAASVVGFVVLPRRRQLCRRQ